MFSLLTIKHIVFEREQKYENNNKVLFDKTRCTLVDSQDQELLKMLIIGFVLYQTNIFLHSFTKTRSKENLTFQSNLTELLSSCKILNNKSIQMFLTTVE